MATATILPFRVSSYALNIYMTGGQRFTVRDGYSGISVEYTPYVKSYAAKNYYVDDIDHALTEGWITADEHQETMDLKTPEDPQYRPRI